MSYNIFVYILIIKTEKKLQMVEFAAFDLF